MDKNKFIKDLQSEFEESTDCELYTNREGKQSTYADEYVHWLEDLLHDSFVRTAEH